VDDSITESGNKASYFIARKEEVFLFQYEARMGIRRGSNREIRSVAQPLLAVLLKATSIGSGGLKLDGLRTLS
jgi:hypothetical protein